MITIEITTIQLVMVVMVATVEIIVTTTIEVEMVVIVTINQISTKIEIKSTLINCKTLMTSIIMKVKEWSMPMLKKDNNKIEAFSTISQEEEEVEVEVEVVEAVGSTEITPGTTIKTQKLLEKVWLPTSNMSIQIIEVAVATIVANEAVEETITPEVTIEETIEVTIEVITVVKIETIVIIIMSQEITIGKMILTRSHIMNLRKISNKKR